MDALSEANGTFAIRLLKGLCQDNPSNNVFYSPVSISSALAMVLLGAKGNTAAQVAQVLSLTTEKDVHQGFQSLLTDLNRPGMQYLLRTANRLFGEKTCEFLSVKLMSCCRQTPLMPRPSWFSSVPSTSKEGGTASFINAAQRKCLLRSTRRSKGRCR